jgi:hypothetical protein
MAGYPHHHVAETRTFQTTGKTGDFYDDEPSISHGYSVRSVPDRSGLSVGTLSCKRDVNIEINLLPLNL